MSRKMLILTLLILFVPCVSRAQVLLPQVWRSYLEQLAEDEEDEMVEELQEVFEKYSDNRLNINDTVSCLREFPFIDEFQRDCLKAYIGEFGPLLSLEELYMVNGFDSVAVELIRPLVVCGNIEEEVHLTLKEILSRGRSNLVLGVSGTFEQARGYRDSIYEGNNLRMMWRYYFKYKDRVQFQISGDKDPGESFGGGSHKKGFDFYGFSLMLNDVNFGNKKVGDCRLKRVIVGQYHLQFGQGLTLWSGYGSRNSLGASIWRYGQGIRPNGAFSEYGYLQGLASTVVLNSNWDLTLFYSYVHKAATLPRNADRDSSINWVQSIYNSGYFRTDTEMAKKSQLVEHLSGGHIDFHNDNLRVGMTGVITWYDKPIVPQKTVYNDNYFCGDWNSNFGLDLSYRHNRWLLFGEIAECINNATSSAEMNLSPAVLIGSEFEVNSLHKVSGQMRYYSPMYHSFHAVALGQSGSPQNEVGGTAYYHGRLPWGLVANISADLCYFPHMKYLVYAPSKGREFRASLSKPFVNVEGLSVSLRYRFKEKERNITPSTQVDGIYQLENIYRHQIQGDVEYSIGPLSLVSRLSYAGYHGDVTEATRGWLFYQDVVFHPKRIPLSVAARVALFDIDDYEARMYTVESDFVYQYNSAVYQNEGYRFYVVLRYDFSKYWNIGFKYGITAYTDKDTFGSGYEQIDASHRQQWRIQIRLKW